MRSKINSNEAFSLNDANLYDVLVLKKNSGESLTIYMREDDALYRQFCKTEIEFVEKSLKPVESLKAQIQVLLLADKEMSRSDHYGVQDGDLEIVNKQLEGCK